MITVRCFTATNMNDPVGPASIGDPLADLSNQTPSSFTLSLTPDAFVASSSFANFSYIGFLPVGGTITDIAKFVSGVKQYDVSGFNIDISLSNLDSVILSHGAALAESPLLTTDRSIMGSAFADVLLGGPSDDTIDGGGGKDTESGGPGNDQFVFDTKLNAHTDVVHITDFAHAQDLIDLSGHIFENRVGHHLIPIHVNAHTFYAARGAHTAHTASTRLIYNTKTGALYFDADGSGHKPAVEFAVLDGHPHLTFHDFQLIA